MKINSSIRAVLGAAALAATGAVFAAGSASAQSADEKLGSINTSCVALYNQEMMDGVTLEQHQTACGCVTNVLGQQNLNDRQLDAFAALFAQDMAALQALDAELSDDEKAGIESALTAASQQCDPGA